MATTASQDASLCTHSSAVSATPTTQSATAPPSTATATETECSTEALLFGRRHHPSPFCSDGFPCTTLFTSPTRFDYSRDNPNMPSPECDIVTEAMGPLEVYLSLCRRFKLKKPNSRVCSQLRYDLCLCCDAEARQYEPAILPIKGSNSDRGSCQLTPLSHQRHSSDMRYPCGVNFVNHALDCSGEYLGAARGLRAVLSLVRHVKCFSKIDLSGCFLPAVAGTMIAAMLDGADHIKELVLSDNPGLVASSTALRALIRLVSHNPNLIMCDVALSKGCDSPVSAALVRQLRFVVDANIALGDAGRQEAIKNRLSRCLSDTFTGTPECEEATGEHRPRATFSGSDDPRLLFYGDAIVVEEPEQDSLIDPDRTVHSCPHYNDDTPPLLSTGLMTLFGEARLAVGLDQLPTPSRGGTKPDIIYNIDWTGSATPTAAGIRSYSLQYPGLALLHDACVVDAIEGRL